MDRNDFDEPTENDKELIAFVVEHCDRWRDYRNTNFLPQWEEYERIFRGEWAIEDKTRDSERSRLVTPMTQQAVETRHAEIIEAIFGSGEYFDIKDDVQDIDGNPMDVEMLKVQMMEDLKKQALRFQTDIRHGWVTKVDFSGSVHKVWVDEKIEIHADTVIISTGASAKWLGLPNEIRLRDAGGGVTACAVCDGFFYKGQTVALVGAGDSACEEATYLAKLCPKVYMLVRRDEFRASRAMVHRVENTPNIEVLYNTEVTDVLGEHGVDGLSIINNKKNYLIIKLSFL